MIVWRDAMSVGAPALDADHRGLIETINALEHWISMAAWSQVDLISADLLRYVDAHFHREEAVLVAIKYYNFSQHKSQHDSMAATINSLHARIGLARDEDAKRSCAHILGRTLGDWLVSHIIMEDMNYRDYIPRRTQSTLIQPP